MKISIITVCYNSSTTIYDTINSVNNQTYPNIEHIFVDGLSSDDTINIINSNAKRNPVVISETDNGLYDAMNKGILLATGDIIGILNSDDVYLNKNIISNIIKQIALFKVDSAYGDLIYTKTDDLNSIKRYWKSGDFNKNKFLFGWMPPHPTFFVKRKIYLKYGMFNLNLKSAADYEIMLRFLFKNSISTTYLNEVLVKMRSGGKSNQNLISRLKGNKEDRLAWKLNNLKPLFITLIFKPLRKVLQFLIIAKKIKYSKKKGMIVSGYFNPIHKGHIEYFNNAKALADELFVIINSDHQRALKGSKEFQQEAERVFIVSNIKSVDHCVLSIDQDRTVCKTIEKIAIDFGADYDLSFANGGDQNNNTIAERPICDQMGITLVDGLGDKIQSSSWLLKN